VNYSFNVTTIIVLALCTCSEDRNYVSCVNCFVSRSVFLVRQRKTIAQLLKNLVFINVVHVVKERHTMFTFFHCFCTFNCEREKCFINKLHTLR